MISRTTPSDRVWCFACTGIELNAASNARSQDPNVLAPQSTPQSNRQIKYDGSKSIHNHILRYGFLPSTISRAVDLPISLGWPRVFPSRSLRPTLLLLTAARSREGPRIRSTTRPRGYGTAMDWVSAPKYPPSVFLRAGWGPIIGWAYTSATLGGSNPTSL